MCFYKIYLVLIILYVNKSSSLLLSKSSKSLSSSSSSIINTLFQQQQETNDITYCLLEHKDVSKASSMIVQVHYKPNLLYQTIKYMYNSKDSSDIYLMKTVNNYVDNAIHYEKTLLKTQIENNIYKRCGDRLKTLDISDQKLALIIVAKKFDEIIGLIEVWPNPVDSNERIGYICNLSVSSNFRKKGVGRQLHLYATQLCAQFYELTKLSLHVENNNKAAIEFYRNKLKYKNYYSDLAIINKFLSFMHGDIGMIHLIKEI